MATGVQTLTIIGAAEGACYMSGGRVKDVRYQPMFANSNSGMSFGAFQHDVATNKTAQTTFNDILTQGVQSKVIDLTRSKHLFAAASKRNAKAAFSSADYNLTVTLLSSEYGKQAIDAADSRRATSLGGQVDSLIANAAKIWAAKNIPAPILTPGGANNLRLFAYLLATLNRNAGAVNLATCRDWLGGLVVHTKNAPPAGFQLTAPPTLEQMHVFFSSFRMWDGSQGHYQYLRDRLDPTLMRLGG